MNRYAALLLAVALATAGCSGGDGGDPAADRGGGTTRQEPRPFRPATSGVPTGFTFAQCSDLRRPDSNTGLAVQVSVPPGYHPTSRGGAGCDFAGPGFGRDLAISVGPLGTLKAEKERDVDPFEDEGGDDSVSDIRYAADVPVFDPHRGERLAYYCYCDGQDLDVRVVQARGVRLSWTTPHRKGPDAATSRAVRRSVGLVRSDRSTCRSRGRTVTFRPPVPQTESIDFYSDRCHLYLRPGRASLLRYAEIELDPPITLDERADRLRARKSVTEVEHEPGSDRLTWLTVRRKPGPYQAPTGTWRAVTVATGDAWVTWSARPSQWRTEADDARRFVSSVRP
ncbi:hypothetical protein GCM10009795_048480 [Nocardioides hankookensis]|uniref:DUF3558 domain-containing protein n=1 Tax=Nocardioides hankookensis TaxID=443157 RepID=A0ABW1LG39_9ACTN